MTKKLTHVGFLLISIFVFDPPMFVLNGFQRIDPSIWP